MHKELGINPFSLDLWLKGNKIMTQIKEDNSQKEKIEQLYHEFTEVVIQVVKSQIEEKRKFSIARISELYREVLRVYQILQQIQLVCAKRTIEVFSLFIEMHGGQELDPNDEEMSVIDVLFCLVSMFLDQAKISDKPITERDRVNIATQQKINEMYR